MWVNEWKSHIEKGDTEEKRKHIRFSIIEGTYIQIFRCEYIIWAVKLRNVKQSH